MLKQSFAKEEISIIDCTLRDGGYYTDWLFKDSLINSYLRACDSTSIKVCEIGLRQKPNIKRFLGPCAFTSESFLQSLVIPSNLYVSVLVNASDIIGNEKNPNEIISELFPLPANESRVNIIRIASSILELEKLEEITDYLFNYGYFITINLLKCHILDEINIHKVSRILERIKFDVLYIADSLGCCFPEDISRIVKNLLAICKMPIGIHSHDNKGLALANTLSAMNAGATFLDSTILGMGRGAGNTKTEELLPIVSNRNIEDYLYLSEYIKEYQEPLKRDKKWGNSIYYSISSTFKLHPTFIQEMSSENKFKPIDILSFIKNLSSINSEKFSQSMYDNIINPYKDLNPSNWTPIEILKDKDILLLGSGPSLTYHISSIERYINKYKPYVISLNYNNLIDSDLINAYIYSHLVSLLPDLKIILKSAKPIIVPSINIFDSNLLENKKNIYQYGLQVINNSFEISEYFCRLPTSLVLAYSLATCIAGKARRINLCGVDGFKLSDKKHIEHKEIANLFINLETNIKIESLLPSNLGFNINSIYNYV